LVSGNYFKLCLMKHLSSSPLLGRLLAIPVNIILLWKGLPGTQTLAYYENT
jgi:hypothetical protein